MITFLIQTTKGSEPKWNLKTTQRDFVQQHTSQHIMEVRHVTLPGSGSSLWTPWSGLWEQQQLSLIKDTRETLATNPRTALPVRRSRRETGRNTKRQQFSTAGTCSSLEILFQDFSRTFSGIYCSWFDRQASGRKSDFKDVRRFKARWEVNLWS